MLLAFDAAVAEEKENILIKDQWKDKSLHSLHVCHWWLDVRNTSTGKEASLDQPGPRNTNPYNAFSPSANDARRKEKVKAHSHTFRCQEGSRNSISSETRKKIWFLAPFKIYGGWNCSKDRSTGHVIRIVSCHKVMGHICPETKVALAIYPKFRPFCLLLWQFQKSVSLSSSLHTHALTQHAAVWLAETFTAEKVSTYNHDVIAVDKLKSYESEATLDRGSLDFFLAIPALRKNLDCHRVNAAGAAGLRAERSSILRFMWMSPEHPVLYTVSKRKVGSCQLCWWRSGRWWVARMVG